MKRLILLAVLATTAFSAQAQLNQACYSDTALVEELIYRKDTTWVIKPVYQKGDWNLYYDFALTKIKSEYHYTDQGVKTGTWKEYYRNGKLRSEWDCNTPLVQLYPPGKEWYADGKIKTERSQTADTLTEMQYFPNGKMSMLNKWNKSGMWVLHKEWCDKGQLLIDYNPTASVPQPVKKYHCNGNLRAEYNWYTFGYTGMYKEYHANGKISVQGQYTEKPTDQLVFMARKTGEWIYFDDKGKVTKKEKWENGKLVSTEK
jgi:antitoxin component YwqK of YwqJK toxin-antitoxin module